MFFDMHCHTEFSHDSQERIESICEKAVFLGLSGIAITDHCDIQFRNDYDVNTPIISSVNSAKKQNALFEGRLQVIAGVEIGEAIWDLEYAKEVISATDYDVILGSVHAARNRLTDIPYSKIDFSAFSKSEIDAYLNDYFCDMQDMIEKCDFDILTHLTCPLTYIMAKYGRKADIDKHTPKIDAILKEIISKNIALEINTSAMKNPKYKESVPNMDILKRYIDLGGSFITLGADGHIASHIAYGFDEIRAKLEALGVNQLYYFKGRKPIAYKIGE